MLRRVRLSIKNTWNSEEDGTQLIQYPNHIYRTVLKNLQNYIWICAPVRDLDQAQSCGKFNSFGIITAKKLSADYLINFRLLFLRIVKLVKFFILWSSLFHSIIVDGKKMLLKKLCFALEKGMLCILLVM